MASRDKRTLAVISMMLKDVWTPYVEKKDNSYGYLCPNCGSSIDIRENYDSSRCMRLVAVFCDKCNISANGEITDLALSGPTLDQEFLFNTFIREILSRLVDPVRQTEIELEAEARMYDLHDHLHGLPF